MARLRDYMQSLMNPESDIERDEKGNLIIRQVEDVDPYQAGIQAQESLPAPPDPNAKPIFMTNIPQGGFGPSYERPGGVPGSEQDRAEIEAQAKAAGSKLIDLSPKQKMPKKPEDWVGSGVDLNAPGVWDGVWQNIVDDVAGGTDLTMIEPNGYVQHVMNIDPSVWPDKFKKEVADLSARIEALGKIKKSAFDIFKYKAGVQEAVNRRKAESAEGKAKKFAVAKNRYDKIPETIFGYDNKEAKLREDFVKAFPYPPSETGPKDLLENFKEAKKNLDQAIVSIHEQKKNLENERDWLEKTIPGIRPMAMPTETVGTHGGPTTTQTPAAGTSQQTEAQKFAAEGKAKGWGPDQTLAEWKKFKMSKAGGKGTPRKSTPAKIIKSAPAQTMPKPPKKSVKPIGSILKQPKESLNFEAGPFLVDIDSMKSLAEDVGLGAGNWKAAVKMAADVAGVTVEMLYLKPLAEIKQLLQAAVLSQSNTRKRLGL